jgi:hypothetical protein
MTWKTSLALACLLCSLSGCGSTEDGGGNPSSDGGPGTGGDVGSGVTGGSSPSDGAVGGGSPAADCSALVRVDDFSHVEDGDIPIFGRDRSGTGPFSFISRMHVNTDGAPNSYHPDNKGITHLCNGISIGASCTWKANCLADFNRARAEGFRGPTKICFFAMATDASGRPIVQGASDPAPGFYVSTTAFQQPGAAPRTPQAQLDSNQIPFIVIPSSWSSSRYRGVRLGDFALVYRLSNGTHSPAVVGDVGPRSKLGEGSVALHQALGNDPFAMRPDGHRRAIVGIGRGDVAYFIFPGSRLAGQPVTNALIEREAGQLLRDMGGVAGLRDCADQMR